MAKKKEPMGFATPARGIEHALEQVRGELAGEKAGWLSLQKDLEPIKDKLLARANEGEASVGEYTALSTCMIFRVVADLGIQIIETHDRLAKVEKAVKELKLGR